MRIGPDDWGHQLSAEQHLSFGREAMTALAGLHKIDIAGSRISVNRYHAEDVTDGIGSMRRQRNLSD